MIKISIAMTTYNGERYIIEQLESIKKQTLKADEVVIFDDASTDRTAKVVSEYIDKNNLTCWNFCVNKSNLGYKENFFQAIKSTTGDIIFLCDQDDIWHLDKIKIMAGLFKSSPDIAALNTGFREIDKDGKKIYSRKRFNRVNHNLIRGSMKPNTLRKFEFDDIIWRNISPGCTAAISRECKEMFLGHYSRMCPHDWELNILASLINGLYFYNRELTDYRIHENNTIGIIKLSLQERLSLKAGNEQSNKRAENECERADCYCNSTWSENLEPAKRRTLIRYRKLTNLRSQMVTKPSIIIFIRAMLHMKNYLKLMGPQGILDDLKHALVKR